MQRKDGINSNSWQAQPIGICHKLYNFIINTLFWPPLKRVTMGRTPNSDTDGEILLHDVSRTGEESSEIVVEFRHSTENWSSKVDNLNAELGKQKTENDDQMARIGIMKPQVQGTSAAGEFEATSTNVDALKGNGPKNTVTIKKHEQKDRDRRRRQQQQQQDKNIPTTVSSAESEFVRKPRLLGVTSNINEKSGAFIESRLKAMRKNFTFETNQS